MKSFTLKNKNNIEVEIIELGAIIKSIKIPTTHGIKDIVLGFDSPDEYYDNPFYFGALVGRFAGRIGGGKFIIDGKEYSLFPNDGNNSLHGGKEGFSKKIWKKDNSYASENYAVKLVYFSRDGEEGYPGNLSLSVVYRLTDENELIIEYSATTDKPTHVNLTNHSYFNLSGDFSKSILDHKLKIYADKFLEINSDLIPTGEFIQVKDTPMDFTAFHKIGERIESPYQQLILAGGYDHTFVANNYDKTLRLTAEAICEESGIKLQIFTTAPGVVFYARNFLDGTINGKNGIAYGKRSGFCLETQRFPDSPNKPHFPSTLLRPEEIYHQKTVYKFLF